MNPLRVAVIGAGYWGPNLIRNLNEAPGAEPVAVADLSKERLEAVHKRFPAVRVTTDHTELFNDKNIDAVAIATPVGTHRKLVEQALAAGKHVFVEKPLAATSVGSVAAAISQPFLFICMRLRLSLTLEFTFFNCSVREVNGC